MDAGPVGGRPLQILQLILHAGRDEVAASRHSAHSRARRKETVMHVLTIHSVSDPEAFWSGQLDLPEGTALPFVAPSSDGTRGVCVFESDSIETVRKVVDGATSQISRNEFYAVNESGAQGLPR
jgi:hypothetical protein